MKCYIASGRRGRGAIDTVRNLGRGGRQVTGAVVGPDVVLNEGGWWRGQRRGGRTRCGGSVEE